MAEELVSERRCAVTVVAVANTLDGPSHTQGRGGIVGEALGFVGRQD